VLRVPLVLKVLKEQWVLRVQLEHKEMLVPKVTKDAKVLMVFRVQ
jgi:hypothetical protein